MAISFPDSIDHVGAGSGCSMLPALHTNAHGNDLGGQRSREVQKVISQQKLSQELVVASPKVGLSLMFAELGGDVFLLRKALNSSTVALDVKAIKGRWELSK